MSATKTKIIGIVLSIAGFVINLASDWINEKQLDAKIAEKVADAVGSDEKENIE